MFETKIHVIHDKCETPFVLLTARGRYFLHTPKTKNKENRTIIENKMLNTLIIS